MYFCNGFRQPASQNVGAGAGQVLLNQGDGVPLAQQANGVACCIPLNTAFGRVGRGSAESTCLLMYQPPLSEGGRRRLEVLRETEDGFRISETDLEMRGAGDMIGTAQSGLPRFRIADLERQAPLMAVAQSDARALLAKDPDLTGPRGQAARVLLWLMKQDQAFRLISVG